MSYEETAPESPSSAPEPAPEPTYFAGFNDSRRANASSATLPPPGDPYWDASHKDHAAAVAAVRQAYARGAQSQATQPQARPQAKPAFPDYDPKHPLYDASHPDHKAAVDAVRREYEARDPEPALDLYADQPHISDLRRDMGVELPEMPAPYAAEWSVEAEGDFLTWAQHHHVETETVNDLYRWYVHSKTFQMNEDDFRQEFQGRLSDRAIKTLIAWEKAQRDDPR